MPPGLRQPGWSTFFRAFVTKWYSFFQAFLGQVARFFSSVGGLVFFKHWPTFFLTFANARAISFYKREGFEIQHSGLDEATGEKDYVMTWQHK